MTVPIDSASAMEVHPRRFRRLGWAMAFAFLAGACGTAAPGAADGGTGEVGADAGRIEDESGLDTGGGSDARGSDARDDTGFFDAADDAGGADGADGGGDTGAVDAEGDAGGSDAGKIDVVDDVDADVGADAAPVDFVPLAPNVPEGYLCDIPPDYVASGGDTTYIPCAIASDQLSDRDPSDVPSLLRVVAWNIEFGKDYATVLSSLQNRPELAGADFLLLSEVSRRNLQSNPQGIDVARELATALAMNYAFAVEWDRREVASELGEHGVAVLSKYPLGNATAIRHVPLNDWYGEDQLYGGRVTLGVDALVGRGLVRVYVSHLDTRGLGGAGRAEQATEIRVDADLPGRPARQVVGGDLNTWTCNYLLADCTKAPQAEQVVHEFLAAGWKDGCEGWNSWTQLGKGFFPQRLDWLFYRGGAGVPGKADQDAKGSDHQPIWFDLTPP